jgi:hypothetical protein
MRVEAVANVTAALTGRLDAELQSLDVSRNISSSKYNVTKLLDGSQLIKSWLIEELTSQVHKLALFNFVSGHNTLLHVGDQS